MFRWFKNAWLRNWPVVMIVALILFGMAAGISLVVFGFKHSPERIPLEQVEDGEVLP